MKKVYTYLAAILILATTLLACKSTDPLVRQRMIEDMENKVSESRYTFHATIANPMSGSSIRLTSPYSLKVTPDTISAHLPYFGRAYHISYPPTEGGVQFVSTDFSYQVSPKEKGMYRVTIDIKDNPNKYNLSLLVGENGFGTLHVTQMHKQSISFTGDID